MCPRTRVRLPLASAVGRRHHQFVRDHHHGLRQVERRIFGRSRDRDQSMAEFKLSICEPAIFAAEDNRNFIRVRQRVEFHRSRTQRCRTTAIATAAACGADRDRAIGDGSRQIRIDGRVREDVVGMHRHLDGLAIVQRTESDQAKVVEAHVLERPRRRADIASRLRPVEHERKFVRRGHLNGYAVPIAAREGGKVPHLFSQWCRGYPCKKKTHRGFHYNKVDS